MCSLLQSSLSDQDARPRQQDGQHVQSRVGGSRLQPQGRQEAGWEEEAEGRRILFLCLRGFFQVVST